MPGEIGFQNVHINRWLTNMAIRYRQEKEEFIALQVFPQIPVENASDDYLVFKREAWLRNDFPVRGMSEEPAYDSYETETAKFSCTERALQHRLDDRITKNADDPVMPDLRATEFLEERALIGMDAEWCSKYFEASEWATSWEGTSGTASEAGKTFEQFNKEKTEPILYFGNRADEMQETTGRRPNIMVLGAKAYTGLRNNKELVERIKYISQQEPALVGRRAMAAAFEVDKIVVARAIYNSALEGATPLYKFIAQPKSALLAFAPDGPSIDTPSAGYTFAWTNLVPGVSDATAGVIYSGRYEAAWTNWYAIRAAYDMERTASELGMFFSKVVA